MEKANSGRRLLEVDVLRPMAIFLVLVLHSFTIYWGKWDAPAGYVDIVSYKWIAAASFSFTMELFVMLSGYVFGYQLSVQNRNYTVTSLMKNKFRRLLVPALTFGVVYALLFYQHKPLHDAVYSILSGAGHLWFLPMLFWCFIFAFLMFGSRMKEQNKMYVLVALTALSIIHFPLRLDKAFYYLFFFYLGMRLMKRQDVCRRLCMKNGFLLALVVLYIVMFVSYELALPYLEGLETGFLADTAIKLLKTYWIFAYALAGTMFIFLAVYRSVHKRMTLPKTITFCSSISFGVYLFHQIIIEVIYYKTEIPLLLGPYLLPWICLLVTLVMSVFSVLLLKKFKLNMWPRLH